MQNVEMWRPTKYVRHDGVWRASRDRSQVAPSSLLVADLLVRHYAELIGAHARGCLLDHGCGQSPLYGVYKDHVSEVVAVDWPGSLHDTSHADEYADLNLTMPFSDGQFDTILSSDVIEHLWNPRAVFWDMARVLKPGGTLIVGTPFNYWLHEAPYDFFRWSPFAIEKLGAEAGLNVIEMRWCGGGKEVLLDTLMKVGLRRLPRTCVGFYEVMRATGLVSSKSKSGGSFCLGTVTALVKI